MSGEKQASLSEVSAQNEAKKQAALAPFAEAEAESLAGLEAQRTTYKGSAVKVEVGAFGKDDKFFPITLSSTVPELPFTTSFRYSIKSASTDELKRKYLEFDAWQKAGALFGEIDASVFSDGGSGFATMVGAWRVKALDASGERTLREESPAQIVGTFLGSADRDKQMMPGSCLFVLAPTAQLSVNGSAVAGSCFFQPNPKSGSYLIRATCADGTVLEEKRNITATSAETVIFKTSGSLELRSELPGELWIDGSRVGALDKYLLLENQNVGVHSLGLRYSDASEEIISASLSPGCRAQGNFAQDRLQYVLVPSGSFTMGSPPNEVGRFNNETQHQVTMSSFAISKYDVTFDEYDAFCAATGAQKPSDQGWGRGRRPVINVSWYDAVAYCNWRSAQEGLMSAYTINGTSVSGDRSANGYRLPTEAEREYAARGGPVAGSLAVNAVYAGSADPANVAWYSGNSGNQTHPVGQKAPNTLGLYDMAGNVCQWCWDWYGDYPTSARSDPAGPSSGASRVVRGGGWYNDAVRSAFRIIGDPGKRSYNLGFRFIRNP